MDAWTFVLAGIGIWLLIEGSLCALAPDFMRRVGEMLSRVPARDLALSGLLAAAVGAGLLIIAVRAA